MAQALTGEMPESLQAGSGTKTSVSTVYSRPNSADLMVNGSYNNENGSPKDQSSKENSYETSTYPNYPTARSEIDHAGCVNVTRKTDMSMDGSRGSGDEESYSGASIPKRRRTDAMINGTSGHPVGPKRTASFDVGSQEQNDAPFHPSSSSASSASDLAGERPASGSDENDADFSMDSSPRYRNTTGPTTGSSSTKEYNDRTSYSSLLNNLRVCGNEILRDLGGSISGPEDECDRPATAGSELTTAAYNNFVRRIVDDTLDRTITFCEQPRHAITALETICAKAWPRMEMKRHRNRIRAYLKACRRNSKKNKGQINMKEAPMNGLSIEARQLVSNALNLVADDVDQLKRAVNRETNKPRSVVPPNATNPSQNVNSISNTECVARSQVNSIGVGLARSSPGYSGAFPDPTPILMNQYGGPLESLPHVDNGLARSAGRRPDGPIPSHTGFGLNPFSSSLGTGAPLDATYMAAMLRLLPTMLQFTNPPGSTSSLVNHKLSTPAFSALDQPSSTLPDPFTQMHSESNHSTLGTHPFTGMDPPKLDGGFGLPTPLSTAPNEDYNISSYDTLRADRKLDSAGWLNSKDVGAPPAHLTSAQYSPTLNEATGKLLDVRLLTQDDVTYFRHNMELSREAMKYAKGVARLIMKKVELLESQLSFPTNGTYLHPMNLS